MSKATIGKLVTAAFLVLAVIGLGYNNLSGRVSLAAGYAGFIAFFVVWFLVYWQMSKRGYFDWWRGADE